MMCFDSSAISGMSCSACRSEAEASAKAPSLSSRAPKFWLRLFSSGLGVAEASSGLILAAFLSFGRVGRPSTSMMPE